MSRASDAIEAKRWELRIKAKDFARALGVCPTHYSMFKNGARGVSADVLRKAYAFGVSADDLLGPEKTTARADEALAARKAQPTRGEA